MIRRGLIELKYEKFFLRSRVLDLTGWKLPSGITRHFAWTRNNDLKRSIYATTLTSATEMCSTVKSIKTSTSHCSQRIQNLKIGATNRFQVLSIGQQRALHTSLRLYTHNPNNSNNSDLPDNSNDKSHTNSRNNNSPDSSNRRITKDQLLKNANNWISRLSIRIKWLLKRSNRPFNTDDYLAIFSWFVISNALLIVLGTTTFFSLLILTVNTVFAQEFVARKFGEIITKNSKLSVIFENAIVPGWKDGKISFKKVLVSRRPKVSKKFVKGSSSIGYSSEDTVNSSSEGEDEIDEGNYTQYDLTIEEVNITLSFSKWVNGKGIIDTMEMKGIRGVIDRTHVKWDPNDSATNYKNVHQPGDFEIGNFKLTDMLVELLQPDNFRPFNVEIYNCEATQLRKHWLFFDLLNCNLMNGSYDGSLFTIHKRQSFNDFSENTNDYKFQRLRINSLNIDHLNRGLEGPFGWITSGKVDMIGDLIIPKPEHKDLLHYYLNYRRNDPVSDPKPENYNDEDTNNDNSSTSYSTNLRKSINNLQNSINVKSDNIILNLTIRLNHVRASVPFQTNELSYINYALIRPIVAYINSKNTFIEINNRIVKNVNDFEGSWTIYDCLLMDDISLEVYDNFVNYVADEQSRLTRMKKITFWSIQLFVQVLLLTIGAVA